jgi:hypothetical protein
MAWKGRKIKKISEITHTEKSQVENIHVTEDQLIIRDFDDEHRHHHLISFI